MTTDPNIDPAASGNDTAAGAPTAAPEWAAGLPDDLRTHPSIIRQKDVAALAREHIGVQELIGRKGVFVPKDGDKPELVAKFREAIGVPDKAEGYELKAPEGAPEGIYDPKLAGDYATVAHKAGLTKTQAQVLHDWWVGAAAGAAGEQMKAAEQGAKAIEGELRKEFGAATAEKIAQGAAAIKALGGEKVLQEFDRKNMSLEVTKWFINLGAMMANDKLGDAGVPRGTVLMPDEASAEIAKITGDPNHDYWNKEATGHAAAVKRMTDLQAMRLGGKR